MTRIKRRSYHYYKQNNKKIIYILSLFWLACVTCEILFVCTFCIYHVIFFSLSVCYSLIYHTQCHNFLLFVFMLLCILLISVFFLKSVLVELIRFKREKEKVNK